MKKLIFCFVLALLLLPAQAKVSYLLTANSISDLPAESYGGVNQMPERNAASWFETEYVKKGTGAFISLSEIKKGISSKDYDVLWVNVDRVGLANLAAAGIDATVISAIKTYVQGGGNLLLTKQANMIAYNIGRIGYEPSWGNGNYSKGGDIWAINAQLGIWPEIEKSYDRRSHQVYNNQPADASINAYTYNEQVYYYETYPMVGAVNRTDNNNMWTDMYRKDPSTGGKMEETAGYTHYDNTDYLRLEDFEGDWDCTVLGVWGQVVDFCAPGLIEFKANATYKGKILTNGFAAYQWGTSNNYLDEVKKLTKNSLSYLQGEAPEPPEPVKEDTRIKLSMELSGGKIKELVSGSYVTLNTAHEAVNMPGAVGTALRTDGYSTYVKYPVSNAKLSTKTLTFSLWCAVQTYPMMVMDYADNQFSSIAGNLNDDAKTGFAFRLSSQGDFRFECYAGGWKVTATSPSKLPVNQWNHLVATMDTEGKKLSLYNNGKLLATANLNNELSIGSTELFYGKSKEDLWSGNFLLNAFNGLLDDLQIDNYVWSDSEISSGNTPANAVDFNLPSDYWTGDLYRPFFHGMPAMNWTNECHGMTYSNGRYHVFFQKNGNGPYMSRLHWGHISSTNLLDWREEFIALYPLNSYDIKGCWSGCVFSDEDITSDDPWILYTGVDNGRASMNMASPNNQTLIKWTKAANNPRIASVPAGYDGDFRDPYYFTSGGEKYIIVGCGKGGVGTTVLYKRAFGDSWNHIGEFFTGNNSGESGSFFEMPNITPMGGGKWLFTATPLGGNVGVRTLYWVGTIGSDGKFNAYSTTPKTVELVGMAKDGFGLLSPTIYEKDGRIILMGIVPDRLPTSDNYDMGWAHTYSLPREISLDANNNLIQKPISEVKDYRSKKTTYSKSSFKLNGTESMSPVSGRHLEVTGTFTVGNCQFGFKLLKSEFGSMKIYYNPNGNELVVDMKSLNRKSNDGGVFDGYYASALPSTIAKGQTLKMDVFLDNSILDVFINDKWATSIRVFCRESAATGVEVYSNGETQVQSLEGWVMNNGDKPTAAFEAHDDSEEIAPVYYSDGFLRYNLADEYMLKVYDLTGNAILFEDGLSGDGSIPFPFKGNYIIQLLGSQNISYKLQAR